MAKQIQVNLLFNANTKQAKAAVRDLQTSLDQITTSFSKRAGSGLTISKELREANDAAIQLKSAIAAAMNPETGTLRLDQLSVALKAQGTTVDQLRSKFMSVGKAGVDSWANMTNAVLRAEKPIKQTNVMLDRMWTTMKNTMRWQLSAAVIQGFTRAVSTAYNHVKDLNESLNNIRIVTGKGIPEMEKFAVQANKAAKALSTTTTAFTDAALIYYQQGLDDAEVLERTEATIKLANAVGQSARQVSEWMTAVWNNFDDGSKSLEYYADVMAALGAATASSADEIAQGLEKFAAIADTVGLSYEYATAALTTVTAQTRQSADVVGTAFKTMFARMQDLELGKTLEDGVTLGQYAATLDRIGVSVLDASGNMREMDQVLSDLGVRWETLTSAEKVATAQGVAGIRQYSQMIALMDNWDSFQMNLNIARSSEGALSEQSEIYAEGWEAASKRVKASAEAIYQSLLDDDFFIGLTDGLADMLSLFDRLIDSMGGLPGLLALITAGMTKFLGPQMTGLFAGMSKGFKQLKQDAMQLGQKLQDDVLRANMEVANKGITHSTIGVETKRAPSGSQNITHAQLAIANGAQNTLGVRDQIREIESTGVLKEEDITRLKTYLEHIEQVNNSYKEVAQNADDARLSIELITQELNEAMAADSKGLHNMGEAEEAAFREQAAQKKKAAEEARAQLNATDPNNISQSDMDYVISLERESQELQEQVQILDKVRGKQTELTAAKEKYENSVEEVTAAEQKSKAVSEQYGESLEKLKQKAQSVQAFTSLTNALSQSAFALTSFISIFRVWQNEDMSVGDKLLSTFTSIAFILPTIIHLINGITSGTAKKTLVTIGDTIANWANAKSEEAVARASRKTAAAKGTETTTQIAETSSDVVDTGVNTVQSKTGGLGKGGSKLTSGGKSFLGKAGLGVAIGAALIAGGIALYKHFEKQYNAVDEAYKKAQKQTQRMRDEYNKTAEASNKLNESIKQYTENGKNLNAMVKGTMEYKQALLEANQQALELINSTESLSAGDYKIVDGRIVIDEEAMEKAQDEAINKQLMAQNRVANAQIQQNMAEARKNRQDTARNDLHVAETGENAKQVAQGATTAAMIGGGIAAAIPGVGWVAGGLIALGAGIVGGIAQAVSKEDESKTEKKAISALEKAYEDNPNLFADGNEELVKAELRAAGISEDNITELMKNTDALEEVVKSNAELALQNRMLYEQMAGGYLEDKGFRNKYGINEEDKGAYAGVLGAALQKQADDYSGKEDTFVAQLDDNDKQIENALKAIYGPGSSVDVQGWGKDGVTIKTKDGQEIKTDQNAAAQQIADHIQEIALTQGEDAAIAFAKEIGGSGNGGFLSMVQGLLDGDYNAGIKAALEEAKQTDAELKKFNTNMGATGPKLSVEARNVINTAIQKGEKVNLAKAGLTFEELEAMQKQLHENWDSYGHDVNWAMEEGILNYEEDIQKVFADANKEFDLGQEKVEDLSTLLSAAELNSDEFTTYAKAVAEATGATELFGEAIAENIIRQETGIKKALTSYIKNMDKLKEANPMDIGYSKAITDLQNAFGTWFNGFKADKAFIEGLVGDGLIEQMMLGGDEGQAALDKIQDRVATQMFKDLNVSDTVRAQLEASGLQEALTGDYETGDTLDAGIVNVINSLITKDGKNETEIEKDQMQADAIIETLKAAGFTVQEYNHETGIAAETVQYLGNEHLKLEEYIGEVIDELEVEIDRYRDLEEILNDLSEATSYYKKVRDAVFNESSKFWDAELAASIKNIEALKRYKERARAFIDTDYSAMTDAAHDLGLAINLDDQDRLSNDTWAAIREKAKTAGSDKKFQEFLDLVGEYEDSLDTYQQKAYEIEEAKLDYLNLSIEKVNETIEKATKITEEQLKTLEWQFDKMSDSADDTVSRIANIGEQMKTTLSDRGTYEQGLKNLFSNYKDSEGNQIFSNADYDKFMRGDMSFITSEDIITEDFLDQLLEIKSGLIDTDKALQDLTEKLQEELLNGFKQLSEEFEDNSKALEHNMKVLDGYRNVIDLLGTDMLSIDNAILAQASAAAVSIAKTQMANAKEQFDFAKSALGDAQKAFADGLLDEEGLKEVEEAYKEVELGFTETLASSIEAINKEFENQVKTIMDNFSAAVGGIIGSLDEVQEWFDKYEEREDFYLKPYEKVYEINTLNREIQDAIQNSDNLKYQRELNELSSELLGYQEEGVEMSDQDLEYMQKRFEVMKAQAAFEEAQNAKKEVRLTRDSQGNYSYVYTANEEAVNKAQADLDKSIYELEKHFDEVQSSLSSMYLKTTKEYADAVAALDKTSETYEQDLQRVTDFYSQRLSQIEGEISESLIRAAKANEDYGTRAKTAFNELVIGQMYTDVKSFSDLHNEVVLPNINSVTNQVTSTYNTWKTNVDGVFEAAGTDVKGFGDLYKKTLVGEDGKGGIVKDTNDLKTAIEGLGSKTADTFEGMVDTAQTEYTEFSKELKKYNLDIENTIKNIDLMLQKAGIVSSGGLNLNPPGGSTPEDAKYMGTITRMGGYTDSSGNWQDVAEVTFTDAKGNKTTAVYDTDELGKIKSNSVTKGSQVSTKNLTTVDKSENAPSNPDDIKWGEEAGAANPNVRIIGTGTIRHVEKNPGGLSISTYEPVVQVQHDDGSTGWYKQSSISGATDLTKYSIEQKVKLKEDSAQVSEQELKQINQKSAEIHAAQYNVVTEGIKAFQIVRTNRDGTIPIYQLSNGEWYKESDLYISEKANNAFAPTPGLRVETVDLGAWVGVKAKARKYRDIDDYDKIKIPKGAMQKDKIIGYDIQGEATGQSNPGKAKLLEDTDIAYYGENKGGHNLYGTENYETERIELGTEEYFYVQGKKVKGAPVVAASTVFLNQTDLHELLGKEGETAMSKQYRLRKISFDTGGYTGSWGPEGRIAMLHQKEIVLNAHDTENLLSSVQIVRSIADKLQASALVASQGLGGMVRAVADGFAPGTLDQNVTIHAEFPNATNHFEIEEAFRNLATTAIQFARPRI